MNKLRAASASAALLVGLGMGLTAMPQAALAQIGIGVGIGVGGVSFNVGVAPPPLPVYEQPPIPAYGYIWQPGFWSWDEDVNDYYWVPGTWVQPPRVGLLWTPGYWGWNGGHYGYNTGYWGAHVGFYGGINYGHGYGGLGYEGGEWRGNQLFYNTNVNNFTNVRITTVFTRPIIHNSITRVSFNGGAGGVAARPTPEELKAAKEPHVGRTPAQLEHMKTAKATPALRASVNKGKPPIAATSKPAELKGPGVKGAAGKPDRPAGDKSGKPGSADDRSTSDRHTKTKPDTSDDKSASDRHAKTKPDVVRPADHTGDETHPDKKAHTPKPKPEDEKKGKGHEPN
jgi:hypothetical protein